ncbi:MAG TPA: type II CAAX endopeptidase family protein [Pyrinomonadaceae bacterium]|nr:type II CAAX endopeptidase family protein [Pyrinomonadaceae bacterium]
MTIPDLFINRAGRLRSFWRLAAFTLVYVFVVNAAFLLVQFGLAFALPRETHRWLLVGSVWAFVVQSVMLFATAALVGWGCGRVIEDLPWRALGWALHRGWARDLLLGLALSAAAIGVAFLAGYLFGGYRLALNAAGAASAGPHWLLVAQTFVTSGLIFLAGAAAEEMLFRGYPFQTLLRSWPVWVALAPTSVFFALVHLGNPNVAPGFTVANTTLAGVWLAVAYWRTRSLWFPLGLHWGWNWAQGALLGSPVSGITELTPAPLLRFSDAGPAWLGGGDYGIEGGAACTLALALSTLFVWRTRLVSATPELRQYTDEENPNPDAAGFAHVVPRSDDGGAPARVHLVYLRPDGVLLSKKNYSDWREAQDDHGGYMTSLGPFGEDELVEFLKGEYGDEAGWPFSREEIRRFMESRETTLRA